MQQLQTSAYMNMSQQESVQVKYGHNKSYECPATSMSQNKLITTMKFVHLYTFPGPKTNLSMRLLIVQADAGPVLLVDCNSWKQRAWVPPRSKTESAP